MSAWPSPCSICTADVERIIKHTRPPSPQLCGRYIAVLLWTICEPAELKRRVLQCVRCTSKCITSNHLKLNLSKSEFMWCTNLWSRHLLDGDAEVCLADTVHNFGVHFYSCKMSMGSQLVWGYFYQLRCIKTIRRFIQTSTTVILVNSVIVFMVDYCNSLLAGLPTCQVDWIQLVLYSAACPFWPDTIHSCHWSAARQSPLGACCSANHQQTVLDHL